MKIKVQLVGCAEDGREERVPEVETDLNQAQIVHRTPLFTAPQVEAVLPSHSKSLSSALILMAGAG